MGMQRSNFNSALTPGLIDKWYSTRPSDLVPQYNRFMEVLTSEKAFERNATITGFTTLSAKSEDASVLLDTAHEANRSFYTHVTYGLGFALSMELMDDGGAMAQAARYTDLLKRSVGVSKEIIAIKNINNASSSSSAMEGNEAIAFASASHVTDAGLQSNILASGADISEAALEALRAQVKQAKDNRNLPQLIQLNTMVIHPNQEADLHRILKSQLQVDQAGSNRNFLLDTNTIKDVVVSNYVTSSTQWQATTTIKDGLKFYVRKADQIDKDNVFLTMQGIYKVIMRVSAGYDDFRSMYFSL